MSEHSLDVAALALGHLVLRARAANVLVAELYRHPGPKTAILIGAEPGNETLAAAVDGLLPGDTLTVVPALGAATPVAAEVATLGSWVADRVRVAESLADVKPADVVLVAAPLAGEAEDVRATFELLRGLVAPGGVLAVAVPALPAGRGAAPAAVAETERQVAVHGVGTDLVLRHNPPVRVHRLRFTPADVATLDRLGPAERPSSVPLTRGMNIDSNGVAAFALSLGAAALLKRARPKSRLWLLPALAAVPVAAFFRDPQRMTPDDPAAVVAASDGKVLGVERLSDARFGGPAEYLRISVFLSVLDVHVNRSPVAGRVVETFVEDGGYAAAMRPAAEHNVAAYTVLDTPHGTVVVAQRTGLIARRIVQRAPAGAVLAKGERFGLIRFGSRTDVYLPADAADPLVAPGDRTLGGETVIARWR